MEDVGLSQRSSDRREFLERSLADLEEEHAAGDLSDDDHARLRADYERRLDALEHPEPPPAAPRHRPPRRASPGGRFAAIAFVIAVAVGAGALLAASVGRRDAGDNITGIDLSDDEASSGPAATGTTLPPALSSCFELSSSEAFDCYIAYTRANPDDARGFLYFGVYSVSQGIEAESQELIDGGETFLRRALEIAPGLVEARANLAILLERTGRDAEAAEVLAPLEGQDLPEDVQQLVDFVRENLDEAAASSTTTPP